MTPQQLKSSILHTAIQGKLVAQRPEEGTGEELYRQIQAEKQRLIKAGKLKKEKPLPEIKEDEIPFEIPKTWKWAPLELCCEMYTGNSISESVKSNRYTGRQEGYDYIATKDVTFKQEICYDNGIKIPYDEGFKLANKDSILMCIEGGSAGRKIGIVDRPVCFGNKLCCFSVQGISNKWLFYYLQTPLFRSLFSENIVGIIGGVSIKKLKGIVIPLPPLAEQKRIVAKIEAIWPNIERYETAWRELEEINQRFPIEMQRSLLHTAIQGKLVKQNESECPVDLRLLRKKTDEFEFKIPENWRIAHLETVSAVVPSKKYQILESEVLKRGRHPVISQSKLFSIGYSNDEKKLYHHNNPVIVFGDHTAEVKYVDFDFIVGADGVKIFNPHQDIVLSKFLFYVLKFYSDGLNEVGGYSRHYKFIKNKAIPLPPLAEQKRIVAKLEQLLPLCERLKTLSPAKSKKAGRGRPSQAAG